MQHRSFWPVLQTPNRAMVGPKIPFVVVEELHTRSKISWVLVKLNLPKGRLATGRNGSETHEGIVWFGDNLTSTDLCHKIAHCVIKPRWETLSKIKMQPGHFSELVKWTWTKKNLKRKIQAQHFVFLNVIWKNAIIYDYTFRILQCLSKCAMDSLLYLMLLLSFFIPPPYSHYTLQDFHVFSDMIFWDFQKF